MEPKGEEDGVRVLDSYAHHPTEVAADLAAARDLADGGRVIAIFQPHLFSRTRIFLTEFGAALGLADEVIVMDIYAAREDPEPGVTGRLVADAVPAGRARYVPDAAQVPAVITEIAKPGDVVLTMGAGDVTKLGPVIVAALRDRGNARVNPSGPGLTTPESGAAAPRRERTPSPARGRAARGGRRSSSSPPLAWSPASPGRCSDRSCSSSGPS